MPECTFCDAVFDDEHERHLHWGEDHADELNSHQEEAVKKAEREEKRRRQQQAERSRRHKELALYAGLGAVGLVVFGMIGSQLVQVQASSPTGDAVTTARFNVSGQPVLGDADAPVTVVEFGDYRCPFCKQFEQRVKPRLKQQFVDSGQVRFVFLHFPFLGEGSTQAAVASECVYRQEPDQFWPFHSAIYRHQGPESERWVTLAKLMQWAHSSTEGLNYSRLRRCIDERRTIDAVRSDLQAGKRHGVGGTPTVYVDGEKVATFRFSAVKQAIERHLN